MGCDRNDRNHLRKKGRGRYDQNHLRNVGCGGNDRKKLKLKERRDAIKIA